MKESVPQSANASSTGGEKSSAAKPTPIRPASNFARAQLALHIARSGQPDAIPQPASRGVEPEKMDRNLLPAPAHAAVFENPGEPIDHRVASAVGNRLGVDFSGVRVHTDPAASSSARALGALAYTFGSHIVFGPGAYQPHGARGSAILAHELTHVAQQLGGNTDSIEAQERQADAVERGGSSSFSPAGAARPVLRMRAGDATSLNIVLGARGSASVTADVEDDGTVTGSASATGLEPGDYFWVRDAGAFGHIVELNGSSIAATARFSVPWTRQNNTLLAAMRQVETRIPLHVDGQPSAIAAAEQRADDTGATTESPAVSGTDARRQELDALPESIRNFLFRPGAPPANPADYEAYLRIARNVADLTDIELAEYRARTTGTTTSVAQFEADVNRWLTEVRARHGADTEHEAAAQALYGLDQVYEMYRTWSGSLDQMMATPPAFIQQWDTQPVSALPTRHAGSLSQLYLDMRRALAPYGYPSLASFTAAIGRFLNAFRESAYYVGRELLDRFDHVLVEQGARYQMNTGAASIETGFAPVRAAYQRAEQFRESAQSQYGGSWDPADVNNYYAAGTRYQEMVGQARAQEGAQLTAQTVEHPLLGYQDFPRQDLASADQANIARRFRDYVTSHREQVRNTRDRLEADHEIIFKLDVLMAQTKARQGIASGSIWSRIIEDHNGPTVTGMFLDLMKATFALAVSFVPVVGPIAGAAIGVTSAIDQYRDYALRSDAYGAQLLSEEPSLTWVVISIIGAGVDLAAVSGVIRPIRGALQAFMRNGDKIALEAQLVRVEARIQRSILAAAELEVQSQRAWRNLAPAAGSLRASLFGADFVVEFGSKIAYSVYLNIRRGINTFNRWTLTREAADLFGQINRLSPAEIQRVRAIYQAAVADAQRIASSGRRLGMTTEEVEAAMQSWARRGSGTADDVIREMARREIAIDRATTTGPVTRSSLPAGHVGGVRINGPNGTYSQFLPLDEAGRATGVVARVDADFLARATGAAASGNVVGRASFQDRGHLLARILGGPDIPQNLAPLLRGINQRDMRMAEIAMRNAIRNGGEATITVVPTYVVGRTDPAAFLMSVRWRDGTQQVLRFANP